MGFTMKSSCAPFLKCWKGGTGGKGCVVAGYKSKKRMLSMTPSKSRNRNKSRDKSRSRGKKSLKKKKVNSSNIRKKGYRLKERFTDFDSNNKNMLGKELEICSTEPMTGWLRNGKCSYEKGDSGNHLVCAKIDKEFLDFTASEGNDLRGVVKAWENWCLCQIRWNDAFEAGKAPKVIKGATNSQVRKSIFREILILWMVVVVGMKILLVVVVVESNFYIIRIKIRIRIRIRIIIK